MGGNIWKVEPVPRDDCLWGVGRYRSTTRSDRTATATTETAVPGNHAQPRSTHHCTGTANRKTERGQRKNETEDGLGRGTGCRGRCSRSYSRRVESGRGKVSGPAAFRTDLRPPARSRCKDRETE